MSNTMDRFLKRKEQLIDLLKQIILLSSGLIGLIATFKNDITVDNQLIFSSGLMALGFTILFGILTIFFLITQDENDKKDDAYIFIFRINC